MHGFTQFSEVPVSEVPVSEVPGHGVHRRAELLSMGVRAHELRPPQWIHYDRDLWAPGGIDLLDPLARIRRAAAKLPAHAAIGGWAAAHLHGATVLDGLSSRGRTCPVPMCLSRQQTCRRTTDVRIWRSDLAESDVEQVDGVRVTTAVRTAFDLARSGALAPGTPDTREPTGPEMRRHVAGRSGGLEPSVVHVEALLRATGLTVPEVLDYRDRHRRQYGYGRAGAVLRLVEPRSASPRETALRLLWMIDADLPRPLVNVLLTEESGRPLGEADLFDPAAGVVAEYDGAVHSGAGRRSADQVRQEGLEQANLVVLRFTAVDLDEHRDRTVARLRRERRRGLSRDRTRDRWVVAADRAASPDRAGRARRADSHR